MPGQVLCAYYALGGEGVAYHDTDAKNHGSGELNPADGSYLNEFRSHDGVDTSYTKFNRKPDPFDDSRYSASTRTEPLTYSLRSATTGSTRAARCAGMMQARRAITSKAPAVTAYTAGAAGLTP